MCQGAIRSRCALDARGLCLLVLYTLYLCVHRGTQLI